MRFFFITAALSTAIALVYPPSFTWGKDYISPFLGVIMFGMGVTLTGDDFLRVWVSRRAVIIAALSQYTVMPLLGLVIGYLFNLPSEIALGLVILGSCPGGTASNVIAYLAGGNVALSVVMTLFSTLLAPLTTPNLVYLIAGKSIDVPVTDMMASIFYIVIIPLAGGFILRSFFYEKIKTIISWLPIISMIVISFVIAVIMSLNQKAIITTPLLIAAAVIIHNVFGMLFGYIIGVFYKLNKKDCRTLSIEVGMQNSGLAASLATTFFTSQSALPAALFSLWHNVSGMMATRIWQSNKNCAD